MHKTCYIIIILLLSLAVNSDFTKRLNITKLLLKSRNYCENCTPHDGLNKNEASSSSSLTLLSNYTRFNYNDIKNLVTFGDSHTEVNTNFTDMSYLGHNFSGSKTWQIHLSDSHNMTLWSFATSGAVINLNITYRESFPIDFLKQYDLFYERMSLNKKYFDRWNSKDTLFAIYLGSNDIHEVNFLNNNKTVNENINGIIQSMFMKIEDIYKVGGRNFLILNISPLDLAPINAHQKHQYYENLIPYFNDGIKDAAQKLFNNHNDINIIVYDTNTEFRFIINEYQKFGFLSGKKPWIFNKNKSRNDYFFYDNTHITGKGNKILAEDINNLLLSLSQ